MSISATVEVITRVFDPETAQTIVYSDVNGTNIANVTSQENLVLPPATVAYPWPFPPGISSASYLVVRAKSTTDLLVQTSNAPGSPVYTVPANSSMPFYNVAALYLSSMLGGTIQVIGGGPGTALPPSPYTPSISGTPSMLMTGAAPTAGMLLTAVDATHCEWRADASPVKKYAVTIGNGADADIVVTHSLNSRDVTVAVYRTVAPFDVVYPDVELTGANTLTLKFSLAPTSNEYRCVVIG